jgi:hypothetical protein
LNSDSPEYRLRLLDGRETSRESGARFGMRLPRPDDRLKNARIKKFALYAGIFILASALIPIGNALQLPEPLSLVAEEYFLLMSQEKVSEAYQMTSSNVQAETSISDFREMNRGSPLERYVSVSWDHEGAEGNWGELQGMIETSDASYPEVFVFVNVELVQENGEWKIYSVELW